MLTIKFNQISLDEVKRLYDKNNGKLNVLVSSRITNRMIVVEVRDIMNNYRFYRYNIEMGWFSLYIRVEEKENYVNC